MQVMEAASYYHRYLTGTGLRHWVPGDPAAQCQDLSSGWWVYTKATLPVPNPFPCLQTGNWGSWLQAATVKPANAATALWFLSSEMQHTVACLSVHGILNLFVGCVYSPVFCLLVCILRQALMQPRLALNSLYSWGWTWTLDAQASTSWAQALQVCTTNPAVFWVCVFNFQVKDVGPSLLSFLPLMSLPGVSCCAVVLTFVFLWPSVSNQTMLLSPLAPELDGPCHLGTVTLHAHFLLSSLSSLWGRSQKLGFSRDHSRS